VLAAPSAGHKTFGTLMPILKVITGVRLNRGWLCITVTQSIVVVMEALVLRPTRDCVLIVCRMLLLLADICLSQCMLQLRNVFTDPSKSKLRNVTVTFCRRDSAATAAFVHAVNAVQL
jgi:hypothetical protein